MVEEHTGSIQKQHANVHAVYLYINLWQVFKTYFFITQTWDGKEDRSKEILSRWSEYPMVWVFTCAWQTRISEAFMNFSLCIRPFLSDCAGKVLF